MNGFFYGPQVAYGNIRAARGIVRSVSGAGAAIGETVAEAADGLSIPLGVSKNFVKYNGQPWNTSTYIATDGMSVPYHGPGEEALVIPASGITIAAADLATKILIFTTDGKVTPVTPIAAASVVSGSTLRWSCLFPVDLIASADITAYSLIRVRVVPAFCFYSAT